MGSSREACSRIARNNVRNNTRPPQGKATSPARLWITAASANFHRKRGRGRSQRSAARRGRRVPTGWPMRCATPGRRADLLGALDAADPVRGARPRGADPCRGVADGDSNLRRGSAEDAEDRDSRVRPLAESGPLDHGPPGLDTWTMQDVLDALTAEQNALEEILTSLDADAWARPSACEGWMVAEVVLHLAQTEEAVDTSTRGQALALPSVEASTVDEVVDAWVAAERGAAPGEVFTRWKRARRAALDSLRTADPTMPVNWVAAPLKPRTLATTACPSIGFTPSTSLIRSGSTTRILTGCGTSRGWLIEPSPTRTKAREELIRQACAWS